MCDTMKKIKFSIDAQILKIDYVIENNTFKNINNTNIINDEDLIFDIRYFKNNTKLIAGFLNVMINSECVKNVLICDCELLDLMMPFLNNFPSILYMVIKPDVTIDYNMYLSILKNDTIKEINCYNIPPYLLEQIDITKNIKIKTRSEVFFISNFIRVNKLNNYADVFYKRKLVINYEFNDADLRDFNEFLTINTHLKTIYFEYISINLIKEILKCLDEHNKKNVLFSIKAEAHNLSLFNEIQTFAKKNKLVRKTNTKFRIDYTREYKLENFIKLLNFTTLKYILVVVIVSVIIGYGINEYDIYMSSKEVESITDDITDLLEQIDDDVINEDTGDTPVEDNTIDDNTPTPTTTKKKIDNSAYYKNYAKVISVLKETNADTVGWLSVNNTNVNYPVVKTTNNSYYLNHDFTKKNNSMGWVFMDYRCDTDTLSQNTIIYGHYISQSSNIMFGSLSKTTNSSWYSNSDNYDITFNTSKKDMKWRIFSIYKIENTNDYLYTNFDNQEQFLEFVDMIKSRSIHDFNTEVKEYDNILTLSTCQNSGKYRLVIHAVLEK